MSGKGSTPRPIPDRERYEAEFDRIFGQGDKQESMSEGSSQIAASPETDEGESK